MSIEVDVSSKLKKYCDNVLMLDAWIQWASNPTSKKAGFGIERNNSIINDNLLHRYSLTKEEANKYTAELENESNELMRSGYGIYELQKEILRQLQGTTGETFRKALKERIEKASIEAKRLTCLLYTLESQGFDDLKFSASWEDLRDKLLAYFKAVYGSLVSATAFDEILRIGVWNKLIWISSGSSGEVIQYSIAPHPSLEEIGLCRLNLEQQKEGEMLIERLFKERRFEELRMLEEVSREKFGYKTFYGATPSLEGISSVIGVCGNVAAISPFLLDQVKDSLRVQKRNQIKNLSQVIENKMAQLSNELWPECDITSTRIQGEQFLWRVDSSVYPRLYIYLTNWLTETDLKNLFPEGSTNAIFVILNQSIPSAKHLLFSKTAYFRYLELLFPTVDSLRPEKVTGERFGYSDKIIELITKKSDTNQESPVLISQSVENSINENKIPSPMPESNLPNPIISIMPLSSTSILIGSENREDQDRGLLGFTVDGGKKVELDMFVGKKQNEERAHTISVFGRPKAGKSYTLGVILEMALVPKTGIRSGPALPVVIFHYDKNTAYKPEFINAVHPTSIKQDTEFLEKLGTNPEGVRDAVILVPPWMIKERSAEFPGMKVCPLTFSTQELGLSEWKLLMGVPSNDSLYVTQIEQLLRENPLDQRNLKSIHDSVENSSMSLQGKNLALTRLKFASAWIQEKTTLQSLLKPGRLIILDIRAEMIDAPEAMRLCLICLGLFQRVQTKENLPMPKFIVLDEAHKYVQKEFADEIVTVINQMRHTFTTVVIASQNPDSIPKEVMEKSSVVILHQITSPDQMSYVKKAVEGLSSVSGPVVASLKKGEAIVWAAESTDPLVSEKGVKVKIRPRFSCHV